MGHNRGFVKWSQLGGIELFSGGFEKSTPNYDHAPSRADIFLLPKNFGLSPPSGVREWTVDSPHDDLLSSMRESLEHISHKILALQEVLDVLVRRRLNRKQFDLLSKLKENEGLLYYRLVRKLSMELCSPESTVRWNLNKLRDAKLIIAGDKDNKGLPVKLTRTGKVLAFAYENGRARRR